MNVAHLQSVSDVVHSACEGHDSTIITYGQTGSGKTHTVLGDLLSGGAGEGLISRTAQLLFQELEATGDRFIVSASVVEIYCERIRDLVNPYLDNLQIGSDRRTGAQLALPDATAIQLGCATDLVTVLGPALEGRVTAKTLMNAASSRSHCIIILSIERAWASGRTTHCRLLVCDLAGSERQKSTAAEGLTLEEGKQINKSLSALSNVVQALTSGKSVHVPYRDSKLTRLLQGALGGAGETAIIICCSPGIRSAQETLSTLRFGARAQGIVNTVQAVDNQELTAVGSADLAKLAALQEENAALLQLVDLQRRQLTACVDIKAVRAALVLQTLLWVGLFLADKFLLGGFM